MKTLRFLMASSFVVATVSVYGQLAWGVNGTGGNGTWDTSSLNWWNGTSNVTWPSGGQAIFAGTPGTVTVSGSVTANKLTFNVPGYAVNSFFIIGVAGGITVETNADTSIGASVFANTSSPGVFHKTGAATLTLTRSTAFFDEVAIEAGELKYGSVPTDASAVYSLANSPNVFLTVGSAGNALSFYSVDGLNGGGANGGVVRPENVAGTRTLTSGFTGGSFAGTLQDNGLAVLAFTCFGAQELTAANSYSGTTTAAGGTLTFSQN